MTLSAASPQPLPDLATVWDFSRPAVSEQRFRALLDTARGDDRLILMTQIARTHGLRRDFAEARRQLDAMAGELPGASPEVRARHALESGRTYASATHPRDSVSAADAQAARALFQSAAETASAARLDALAIDALHMMAFVDTAPADQLTWARRGLTVADASDQPAARRWQGSLHHNAGFALQQMGEHAQALEHFRRSGEAYTRDGRTGAAQVAEWMAAHSLRRLGRLDEALAIQTSLLARHDAAGTVDVHVLDELVELYRARGDTAAADRTAARRAALPSTRTP